MAETSPGADEKVCPYCAETIKAAAIRCRWCRADLSGTGAPADSPPAAPGPASPAPGTATAESTHEADDDAAQPVTGSRTGAGPESRSVPDDSDAERLDRLSRAGLAASPRAPFLASRGLTAALVVLVLLVGAGAAWLVHHDRNPTDGAAPSGQLTAAPARNAAMAAATSLTQQALSYRWSSLDKDIAAAQQRMTPGFRKQYDAAMAKVHAQTLSNKITLKATAVATSLVSLSDHEATALVFVNQVTTAQGSTNQRVDQNRVVVTLTRTDGDWHVSKMDAF